jgi:hypothetical protein
LDGFHFFITFYDSWESKTINCKQRRLNKIKLRLIRKKIGFTLIDWIYKYIRKTRSREAIRRNRLSRTSFFNRRLIGTCIKCIRITKIRIGTAQIRIRYDSI